MESVNDSLPSGRWVGFYLHRWSQFRHRMDLHLVVTPDRITGIGGDDIGPFTIAGRIDPERRVTWIKSYRTHDVS